MRRLSWLFGVLAILAAGTPGAWAESPPYEVRPCLECHGPAGLAKHPGVPFLFGQDRNYLMQQIAAFQREVVPYASGFVRLERKHPVMSKQAPALPRGDVPLVVDYFSQLSCISARGFDNAPQAPEPPRDVIAHCYFCHGYGGHNHLAFVPNLAGQRAGYLREQLHLFRDTKRVDVYTLEQGRSHPMMTRQGSKLTDKQIDAIADYFAGLPCR